MKEALFNPKEIIPKFDEYMTSKGLTFEAVAIGGSALAILDIVHRSTRDVDLLELEIPDSIQKAAKEFAANHNLSEHWLNAGPSDLLQYLPKSWREHVQPLYSGTSLKLKTLGRIDLLRTKFWAMCDRMRDIEDIIAMNPSVEELAIAIEWVKPLDGNPGWINHVDTVADALKKRLDHD